MVDFALVARFVTDGEHLASEVALASSRLGKDAVGFCVLLSPGTPPALAKTGALIVGGPSAGDAHRSFFYDTADIPVAQRDRWIDPLGAGLVPRQTARRAPVAGYMQALGVQRSLRCCICIGPRMVAAIGHAYALAAPPSPQVLRQLEKLSAEAGQVLRAHVLLAETSIVRRPQEDPSGVLTRRQWQIARRATQGLTNAQIAAQLRLSPATVKTVLERLYKQTGTRGRVALARWIAQR